MTGPVIVTSLAGSQFSLKWQLIIFYSTAEFLIHISESD